ncbi:hypothetical protein RN001_015517 [Aquatica leii]|uniref:Caspase family p20 domain-containing protein n=1 Tax=Aquatica leii TaxID=1421715 RepID=A0AAN7P1X1_9COLE|nr:hypothetical protein RN001_015517 [Aquatica leii]
MESDSRRISTSETEEKYPTSPKYEEPYEEDEIHVPPSTELVPDEYDHKDNKKGLVLIFHSKCDVESKDVLVKEFTDQGYDVSNVFGLTTKDIVTSKLRHVAQENNEDKTCLIMFFLGTIEKEDKFYLDDDKNFIVLKDVWLNFTADNCPTLRNKPKVFVFQGTKKPAVSAFDAKLMFTTPPKGAYNVPSEADMLLIYTRVDSNSYRELFIKELCNKIDKFGKRDDIINLVTQTGLTEKRPLIISTLTRKFYVTFSEQRGHYYDLNLNHTVTVETLEDLRKHVSSKVLHEGVVRRSVQIDGVKNKSSKSTPKSVTKPKKETRPPWKL